MHLRSIVLLCTKDPSGCSHQPELANRRLNATLRDPSDLTSLCSGGFAGLEAAVPVVEAVRVAVLARLLATPGGDVAQRGAAGGASTDDGEGGEYEQRADDPRAPAHGDVRIRRT